VLAALALGVVMSAAVGAPEPRGEFVDIGGRKLRIVCTGPKGASPVVILEAGAFGFSADWAVVQDDLAAQGVRSCAYDRAGLGYSDPGPAPRDGVAVAEDLEKLLKAAGEEPPYILVGHSMAGTRIRLFYGRNRDRIGGLVYVDAAPATQIASPEAQRFLGPFTTVSKLAGVAATLDLLKPLAFMGDTIGLPPGAAAEKRWAFANARHNRISADEVVLWTRAAEQAVQSGPIDPSLPVAVVTAGHGVSSTVKNVYAEPAVNSQHGYFAEVKGANHADLLGRKHAAEVVKGIDFVLAAAHDRSATSAGPRAGG
jgi:pimeloyl-ACP methyl ester carboxylesterase